MRGHRKLYSAEELAFIEKNKNLPRAELHFEFVTTFDRFDITKLEIQELCTSRGWLMDDQLLSKARGARHGLFKNYESNKIGNYISVYSPETGKTTLKQRVVWEVERGPIPPGHVLKCKTADRTNCSLSNWTLIPSQMIGPLVRRGYESAPPALKETILAATRLEYEVRQKLGKSGSRRKG